MNTRILFFFLLLLSLSSTTPARAQAGRIVGTVVDEAEAPVVRAAVVLAGTLRGTLTDEAGRFELGPLAPGTYTLQARALGYEPAEATATVTAGGVARLTLRLATRPVLLEGVEVVARRPGLEPLATLDARRVRETHAADAGALLRLLPGLNAARRGALGLDPNIRGLVETEVGAYVDGVRFFPAGPLRMDSQISHFDPTGIARVEVVKGPYALTWGAGNMAAIRVERFGLHPPAGLHATLHTGYDDNVDAFASAATASYRQGRVSAWLHGAYRQGNDYRDGDGTTIPADFRSGEVRARVGVQTAPGARLTFAGGYNRQDDIDYPGRLLDADFFDAVDLSARYAWIRTDGLLRHLDVQLSWNRVAHDMDNEDKPTARPGTFPDGSMRPALAIRVETASRTLGGRAAAELVPAGDVVLTFGADFYGVNRDGRRPFEAIRPDGSRFVPPFYVTDVVWPDVTITDVGLFGGATHLAGAVELSATARLDLVRAEAGRVSDAYLSVVGGGLTRDDLTQTEANLSGALTLALRPHPAWTVSLGAGSVVRTADALERYADRFPASKAQTSAEFVGNPTLDPERSTQVDLWLEGTYPRVSASLNVFARRMDDYITLEATDIPPLLPLSPPIVYRYVNGEATFYGGEAAVAVRLLEALTLSAGAHYLWGRDETLDEPALGVTPLTARLGLRYDAPGGRFFAEATTHLVGKQTRVAVTRGEQPTDGYTTADVRLGLRLLRDASLLLGVNNVFDAYYVNHLNAANPFTRQRIPEPGRVLFASVRVAL
ncbi:TonB-dependent receptor [Rhodocaloribacter litoris]|uniref:TonB-dependent receptor n=1 Tax=Rhodocaloribacter litoris TaxID=2558931 RepID=UPI001E5E1B2B|nr:TonB-dependent receptor [Rhodocaloribacter litoris]QXD15319.1 TonB-dependent receptor [Rhodocaloribacter litoris]